MIGKFKNKVPPFSKSDQMKMSLSRSEESELDCIQISRILYSDISKKILKILQILYSFELKRKMTHGIASLLQWELQFRVFQVCPLNQNEYLAVVNCLFLTGKIDLVIK